MTRKRKYKKLIYAFLTLLLLVLTLIGGRGIIPAFADVSSYTSALEDLQKDSTFNTSKYPDKANDYSIQVIQIAESVNGELFVYTYQPCQKTTYIVATGINMSLSESVNGTKLYGLSFINSSGVLCKYKVNSVGVSKDTTRYYNISSICRNWLNGIDKGSDNGNITNGKAYGVGQCWRVTTQGNTVTYKMIKVDTVEIINPFTSYIRRSKNQSANGYYQDNYFVAFSTDRNIDKLLSATVSYRIQDYFYKENNVLGFESTAFWDKSTFSNEKRTEKEVYCDEVNELHQDGFNLFGVFDLNKNYSWSRIQSSADFVKNAGANSSDNNEVKKLQWVLMFDETSIYRYESSGSLIIRYEEAGQIIDEVTVLRLEFVEGGVTYNLGAVSNTVSKPPEFSDKNDDDKKPVLGFWEYVWNCIVKLFAGTANFVETAVAIGAMVVSLIVLAVAVFFLKLIFGAFFGK